MAARLSFKSFLPLIYMYAAVSFITVIKSFFLAQTYGHAYWMYDFMGIFFLISGALKLMNLAEFAKEYRKYDVLARQSSAYAYAYPFIELVLGAAYLIKWQPYWVNLTTLILMLINSAGIGYALYTKQAAHCVCLGHMMRVPVSIISLLETFVMAGMAAWMLMH